MRRATFLLAACAVHPSAKAPAKPSGPWAVAFERSLRNDYVGPFFTASGEIVASGERFDAQGRYLGRLAMEIPGGRALSSIHAILPDGTGVATIDDDHGSDDLIVGRADQDPEKATARVHGTSGLAISADGQRAAAYDDRG